MTSAVVFAYHAVGARCLRVLLAHGIKVPLVVTHRDDAREHIWFERVADVATHHGIPWIAPDDPNAPGVVSKIASLVPDFLFSFYYRRMLGAELLAIPKRGALNLHGSLLPKYRGRAPVNWAVLHGETETGATLHYMTAKPDAGEIVAQQRVPILPEESAKEVFDKVTRAAETALDQVLPALMAGTAPRMPNDIAHGSYFGARTPEDGRIDWQRGATEIHNLVRAVAPPYPGAFCDVGTRRIKVTKAKVLEVCPAGAPAGSGLFSVGETVFARCGDGKCLAVLAASCDDRPLDAATLASALESAR